MAPAQTGAVTRAEAGEIGGARSGSLSGATIRAEAGDLRGPARNPAVAAANPAVVDAAIGPIGASVSASVEGTLRPDWREHRDEILQAARDVVSLYLELDAIFGEIKAAPSQRGDNAAGERAEALADIREDLREGQTTARLVEEQVQSDEPQGQVLSLAERMLRVLAHNAKWCTRLLSEGAMRQLGADLVPGLHHKLEKLPHLLHRLAALLRSIF